MSDQVRHFVLLWCCASSFVAAACGAESPTGGTVDEVVDVDEAVEGSLLSIAGDAQVGNLGKPLSDPLIAKVVDPSGNGLGGVTVRWSASSNFSFGVYFRTSSVTDAQGLGSVQWTLGGATDEQTATEHTLRASAFLSGVDAIIFTATTPPLVPLIDMGASTYFGFPGGLYPGGNVMPQAHADAGQAFAAAIEPLDVNGDPSPTGKYVLLVNGHSNTMLMS